MKTADGKVRVAGVVAAAVLVGALAGVCAGGEGVFTTTVKDAKSGKDQPVQLWLPPGVEVVRGAFCQMRYNDLVTRDDYRRVAAAWRFALIGGMLEHGGDLRGSLESALKTLAAASSHPEVEHMPLLMSGFSNGGWMAVNLTKAMPERVIAAAPTAMPGISHDLDNPAHVAAFRQVPVLQTNGSNDGATHRWHETHHPVVRKMRYLWGLAHQWHVKHEFGNTNALVWPFFRQAVALRLPPDSDARKGPVKLRPVKESDGWLGDTGTWQTNWATIRPFSAEQVGRLENTWLLDEEVACVWRAFVACRPGVQVSIAPDASAAGGMVVAAEGKLPAALKKVQFFDGKALLGEATARPYETRTDRLARDVHSVYAVCVESDGRLSAARPVLVVGGAGADRQEGPARDKARQ